MRWISSEKVSDECMIERLIMEATTIFYNFLYSFGKNLNHYVLLSRLKLNKGAIRSYTSQEK
ncbi:hypothetical protein BpHYR1_051111 [Brachionus plicatilis]|uniref:Uncharacterized protein n=1 Tax=Brachionus plicatilis TaxID=10195 RepID=A0A3M7PBL4_BRAPC|nr:hypothetical protein BpHYR1_051111 [Brachionus plicatilis]